MSTQTRNWKYDFNEEEKYHYYLKSDDYPETDVSGDDIMWVAAMVIVMKFLFTLRFYNQLPL